MPITVAQSNFGNTIVGNAITAAFLSNTTTGNTIVVIPDTSGAISVSSITLSSGSGSFSKIVSQVGNLGIYQFVEAWAAPNITGGTTPTVSATYGSAPSSFSSMLIYELAGMPSTLILDGTPAGVAGSSSALMTSPIITTRNPGSIIYAVFAGSGSIVSGQSGWTNNIDNTNFVLWQFQIQTRGQTNLASNGTQTPAGVYAATIFALAPSAIPAGGGAGGSLIGAYNFWGGGYN